MKLPKLFKKKPVTLSNLEAIAKYTCVQPQDVLANVEGIKTLASAEAELIKATAELTKAKSERNKVFVTGFTDCAKTAALVACTCIAVGADTAGVLPVKSAFSIVTKML